MIIFAKDSSFEYRKSESPSFRQLNQSNLYHYSFTNKKKSSYEAQNKE